MLITRPDHHQGGFAIFSALFILLFMALLSGGIAAISANALMGSAGDIMGVQARLAARAGSEWGVNRAWNADTAVCPNAGGYSNFSEQLFGGMAVTVYCRSTPIPEVPARNAYEITAWACNQPSAATLRCPGEAAQIANPGYVERKVFAIIER